MQSKEGASNLVQETFLEVQKDFARFQGNSEEELLAWARLRNHCRNNLANFARRYRSTGKRRIDREVSLDAGRSDGTSPNRPAALSPSECLIADEQVLRQVQESLDRLPALLPPGPAAPTAATICPLKKSPGGSNAPATPRRTGAGRRVPMQEEMGGPP